MQQTENYKLNLIETSDTFSPAPLNENAQTLETILSTETAALDARVTTLEAHKIATGLYQGTGHKRSDMYDNKIITQTVDVGFDPVAVIVCRADTGNMFITIAGHPYNYIDLYVPFEIVPGGFTVRDTYSSVTMNGPYDYWYLALA